MNLEEEIKRQLKCKSEITCVGSPNVILNGEQVLSELSSLKARNDELEAAHKLFRERLGPAGMKMITDLNDRNEQLERVFEAVKQDIQWQRECNGSTEMFTNSLKAIESADRG